MKMKVPYILIASWPVVLASGDAFTPEGIPHCLRQTSRGPKEIASEHFWDVQKIFIMATRYH
jgi:hypothetical protein